MEATSPIASQYYDLTGICLPTGEIPDDRKPSLNQGRTFFVKCLVVALKAIASMHPSRYSGTECYVSRKADCLLRLGPILDSVQPGSAANVRILMADAAGVCDSEASAKALEELKASFSRLHLSWDERLFSKLEAEQTRLAYLSKATAQSTEQLPLYEKGFMTLLTEWDSFHRRDNALRDLAIKPGRRDIAEHIQAQPLRQETLTSLGKRLHSEQGSAEYPNYAEAWKVSRFSSSDGMQAEVCRARMIQAMIQYALRPRVRSTEILDTAIAWSGVGWNEEAEEYSLGPIAHAALELAEQCISSASS